MLCARMMCEAPATTFGEPPAVQVHRKMLYWIPLSSIVSPILRNLGRRPLILRGASNGNPSLGTPTILQRHTQRVLWP